MKKLAENAGYLRQRWGPRWGGVDSCRNLFLTLSGPHPSGRYANLDTSAVRHNGVERGCPTIWIRLCPPFVVTPVCLGAKTEAAAPQLDAADRPTPPRRTAANGVWTPPGSLRRPDPPRPEPHQTSTHRHRQTAPPPPPAHSPYCLKREVVYSCPHRWHHKHTGAATFSQNIPKRLANAPAQTPAIG